MIEKGKHIEFLQKCLNSRDVLYYLTEPSRISTVYWIVNSYRLLKINNNLKNDTLQFLKKCKNKDGGYGGSNEYPSTILATFNALQILYIYEDDFFDPLTVNFILGNFDDKTGKFRNDKCGMTDNRINCSGVLSLHLLWLAQDKRFDSDLSQPISREWLNSIGFNYKKCVENILNCYNLDGGFGLEEGDESHCAFTFCCLSILRSLRCIDSINKQDISRFIQLRQESSGGLSGRFDKKEDVCYSFWAYASLVLIGKDDCIDKGKLTDFILQCQSSNGGFSDRPGDEPDPYHLMFALAGLSLLGYEGLLQIDPGFAFYTKNL